MRRTLLAAPILLAFACNTPSSPSAAAPVKPAAQAQAAMVVTHHGGPISAGKAERVTDVLKNADALAGKTVLVEGTVRAACSKKGCWMELADGPDKAAPGCRVTFKDYAFFVPTDSAGSEARIEGVANVRVLSKEEADHLAGEGARIDRAADGTAREVRIVATGVELRRPLPGARTGT
jgi:hypothetical protein